MRRQTIMAGGLALGIGIFVAAGYIASTGQFVPGVPHQGTFSAPVTLTSVIANALTITSSGADADNRGIQIHQFATGASAGGINIQCDGAATSTICASYSCINGATCRALESSDGNVVWHSGASTGTTTFKGAATFLGATFTWGSATTNTILNEGHLSSPSRGGNCTSGTGSTITGNNNFITLTTGTTSTACTLSFASPVFTNPPTCVVVAVNGSQQASTTYTTTSGTLQITASPNSATYHITCVGH